ncbi:MULTISPECIES: SusE domain-containing protein [Parabacteroides]|uniref:SusE domain-containing protein n=1 Tax=Parabacteroides leei TaxID=2939491 RepID=UPI00189B5A6C|nr:MULTISPECIES: SusE domain-containing protein [Parabacteroides]MCL3853866.1 SusE domain-containing protein [Parabacteroides leei]
MKAISITYAMLFSFILAFTACSSDGEVRDLSVTAVKTLYEPDNGKAVVLQPSASASLYFEWEPSLAEDGGVVLYEVVFDKADGDFSDPVYISTADNNGGSNHATITHKQLNQIAALAGIESAAQGTLKWTVYASKGINPVRAEEERTLTLTRLAGFAEVPGQLYITGEATEVGADLDKAMVMKKVADGEFEVFIKLTEGKSFKFVSANTGTPTEYSLNGEKLVEGGSVTAAKTGIYKYYIDFNAGSFTSKEVTKVKFYLNWSQKEIELDYQGLGVWALNGYTITGLTDSDNTDDRYKFRMESSDGETEWRAAINNDSKPTGNDEYYYMVEKTNVEQWTNNEVWKTPATDGWSDKTYDITFSLNTQGEYTHNLVIK